MTFRTASICLVGIATLGIARLVTLDHAESDTAPARTFARTARPVAAPSVSQDEILRMGPAEWKKRFESNPTSTSPHARKAIASLSGDLQQLLASGADPQGEDARVYTEAILALLTSKWEE